MTSIKIILVLESMPPQYEITVTYPDGHTKEHCLGPSSLRKLYIDNNIKVPSHVEEEYFHEKKFHEQQKRFDQERIDRKQSDSSTKTVIEEPDIDLDAILAEPYTESDFQCMKQYGIDVKKALEDQKKAQIWRANRKK